MRGRDEDPYLRTAMRLEVGFIFVAKCDWRAKHFGEDKCPAERGRVVERTPDSRPVALTANRLWRCRGGSFPSRPEFKQRLRLLWSLAFVPGKPFASCFVRFRIRNFLRGN